jgi:hypothetical protein
MRTRFESRWWVGAWALFAVGCPQFENDFVIASDAAGLPSNDAEPQGSTGDASDAATTTDGSDAATAPDSTAADAAIAADVGASDGAPQEASPMSDASSCSPGALQCSGLQPQLCENGEWHNVGASCVSQACVGGACAGTCTPGATQCSGLSYAPEAGAFIGDYTTTQTCSPMGQWGAEAPCSQPTPTCKSGSCYCAFTICNGMCVDEATDNNNCGACGVMCSVGHSCEIGSETNDAGVVVLGGGKCAP